MMEKVRYNNITGQITSKIEELRKEQKDSMEFGEIINCVITKYKIEGLEMALEIIKVQNEDIK